ncbi:MAG: DEAD/DEAH box helicase family protein [Parachlamydiales bacterium]|jgi:hypothetical protein
MSTPRISDFAGYIPHPPSNPQRNLPSLPFVSPQREEPLSQEEINLLSRDIEHYSLLNTRHETTNYLGAEGNIKGGLENSPLFLNLAHLFSHPWLNLPGIKSPSVQSGIGMARALFAHFPTALKIFDSLEKIEARIDKTKTLVKNSTNFSEIAHQIKQAALETAHEVRSLPQNQEYYIPIQYHTQGGIHKIFVNFKRIDNDKYDVLLWSTDRNTQEYQTIEVDNAEAKNSPIIHFTSIPSSYLFFNDDGKIRSDFFEALLQTTITDNKIELDFITNGIFKSFWPHYNNQADQTGTFVTGQRPYESNWNVLKTMGYQSFADKETYKTAKIRFLTKALIEVWDKAHNVLAEDNPGAENCRQVLKDSAKHLQKMVFKYFEAGYIDEDEIKQIRVTTQDIIERITAQNNAISDQRQSSKTPIDPYAVTLNTHKDASREAINSIKITRAAQPAKIAAKPLFTSTSFVLPAKPKEIKESLETLATAMKSEGALQTPLALISQVEQVVSTLSLFDDRWAQLDAEQLESVLKSLDSLGDVYQQALVNTKSVTQSKHSAIFDKLYALTHILALKYDSLSTVKTNLKNYIVHYGAPSVDQPEIEFDPHTAATKRQAQEYFKQCGRSSIAHSMKIHSDLRNLPQSLFNFENSIVFAENEENSHDAKFYLELAGGDRHKALQYATNVNPEKRGYYSYYSSLLNSKTPHIHHLRSAAMRSQFFQHQKNFRFASDKASFWEAKVERSSHYKTDTISYFLAALNSENKPTEIGKFQQPTASPEHTFPLDYYRSQLIKDNTFRRKLNKTENETLTNKETEKLWANTPYTPRDLLLCTADRQLLPFQLIEHFTRHIAVLTSNQEQALFETLFFRTYITSDPMRHDISVQYNNAPFLSENHYDPTGQLLEDELALQARCKQFIEKGLERYVELQYKKRPVVDAALFFVRFGANLHQRGVYDAKPLLALVNQWLELDDLTPNEKYALHQHRLYLYSVLNSNQIGNALESWYFLNKESRSHEWTHPYLTSETQAYAQLCVQKALETFDSPQWEKVAQNILSQNHLLKQDTSLTIKFNSPGILTATTPSKEEWNFYLSQGMLKLFENTLTKQTGNWDKSDLEWAKEILGEDPSAQLTHIGSTSRYVSKKLGPILFPNNSPGLCTQREINGSWYQYLPSHKIKEGNIPSSLFRNTTAWVSLNTPREVIYSSKENGNPLYVQLSDGTIHPAHDRSITLHPYMPKEMGQGLDLIEDPAYILVEENSEGEITGYSLPRFNARFLVKDKEIVLESHPHLVLAPLRQNGLLYGNNNYLVLINKYDGSSKIMCSNRKIVKSRGEKSAHISIRRPDSSSFIFFDYANGSVKPRTLSERVILSNILLGQEEYLKAKTLLDSIEPTENVDILSAYCLERIITYAEKYDSSVEAAAIGLKANYLLKNAVSETLIQTYLSNIKRLSTQLELPKEMELALLRLAKFIRNTNLDKIIKNRKEILNKKVPSKQISSLPNIQSLADINTPSIQRHFNESLSTRYGTHQQTQNAERKIQQILNSYDFIPTLENPEISFENYLQPFIFTNTLAQAHGWQTWKKMFYSAYLIARGNVQGNSKSQSEAEKKRLAFRLQLWGANSDNFKNEIDRELYAYLQTALQPNAMVPDAVTPVKTYFDERESKAETIWNFIYKLNQVVKNNEGINQKKGSSPLSPKWAELQGPQLPYKTLKKAPKKVLRPQDNDLTFPIQPSALASLREQFIPPLPEQNKVKRPEPTLFSPPPITDPSEEVLEELIQTAFDEFNPDYIAGIEENANQENKPIEPEVSPDLFSKMATVLTAKESENTNRSETLLNLANKTINEFQRSKREAEFQRPLIMEDLHHLFNQKSRQQYLKANPNLTENEVSQLYQMTAEHLQASIEIRKIKELMVLGSKLTAETDNSKRQDLLREIRALMRPLKEIYDPQKLPTVLVFDYMSKMTPRPKQVFLLEKMSKLDKNGKYVNRIVQLIMGGGKTAVLSSILLSQAARSGRRAILIVQPEQLGSVKANLRKSQRQNFNQGVISLEYPPDKLNSVAVLNEIIQRMNAAEKTGDVILMTPQLMEFLWAYLKKESLEAAYSNESIELMADICNSQREKGDALGDEIDQLLNLGYAVDIPGNEPQKLKHERILLVEQIYKYFNSDSLQIPDENGKLTSLKEWMNLKENKQKGLSPSQFKNIYSVIAQELANSFPSMRLHRHPDLHSAFIRYAVNSINPELQRYVDNSDKYQKEIEQLKGTEKDDFLFLQYFKKLKNSKRSEEREAADEIAIVRHLYKDILPTAFAEDAGRNFGRLGIDIVPYEGAGIPALTEIGYHYRKLVLWFQNLFGFPPGKDQLIFFTQKMRQKAEQEVLKTKKLLNDTPSGVEYFEATGIRLSESDNPAAMDAAVKNVQSDPLRSIRIEREIAAEKVTYFPERYTANGLTLAWLFNSFRGFSGTPWNYLTFASKLVKNILLDVGTEGSIIDKLFRRESNGEVPIHETTNNDPEYILNKIVTNNPNKERIVGFLDASALSKHIPSNDVPGRIWKFYNPRPEKGSEKIPERPIKRPINHIFYLHHPGGNGTPIPCVYSEKADGTSVRTFLDGTQPEDFQKANVDINACFFLINEKGCTGTDVPQPDDAINILSVDYMMLRRTFFQSLFRLRQILNKNQNIEIVLNTSSMPKMDQNGKNLRAQMNTFIKNQAIELGKRIDEAFQYKADFILESTIMEHFILGPRARGEHIDLREIKPYQEFLRTTVQDKPSEDFGSLEYTVDTKEDLVGYANDKLAKLKKIPGTPQGLIKKIETQIKELIEEINASKHLAEKKTAKDMKGLGVQVTVVQQSSRTVTTERTVEVNQEIKTELNRYNFPKEEKPAGEFEWTREDILAFLKDPLKSARVMSLHDALDRDKARLSFSYERPYKNIFGNLHYATDNFLHTQSSILPIFHNSFKRFQQILFIETRTGIVSVQLSKKEAGQFINLLRHSSSYQNVWLVDSNGQSYYDNPRPLPNNPAIRQTLVEVNASNGNMAYLDANEEDTSIWLNTECTHEKPCTCFDTKQKFVALKVLNTPLQNELFVKSDIFHPNLAALKPGGNGRLRLNPDSIAELDTPEEIELLQRDQVNHLSSSPILNLKELQTYYLKEQQIGWLRKPELIATLTPQQFIHLHPDQMQWIHPKQVPWIGNDEKRLHALIPPLLDSLTSIQLTHILDEQVEEIQLEKTLELLNDQKIKFITQPQVALITQEKELKRIPEKWKWITPAQVKAGIVTDDMIPFLEIAESIQALPIDKMHLVPIERRHQHISDAQLQIVHTNLTVFNSLDKSLIQRIHETVAIQALTKDFVPHMSPQDYGKLSEHQVKQLEDADVLKKLPQHQITHVANEQIQHLAKWQLTSLNETQVLSIKDQHFFCYLSNVGLGYLTPAQIALITDRNIMASVIPKLPPKQIELLNADQIKFIKDDNLPDVLKLKNDRWKDLSEAQLDNWRIHYDVARKVQDIPFFDFIDLPSKLRSKGDGIQNFFAFPYRTITGLISAAFTTVTLFTPIFWLRNYYTQPLWNFISRPVRRLFS